MDSVRADFASVIIDREAYAKVLRESAPRKIRQVFTGITLSMESTGEHFEHEIDTVYLRQMKMFCIGIYSRVDEDDVTVFDKESIMFAFIKAFVSDDRTMTEDQKYFKLGQDDDVFVENMIEYGKQVSYGSIYLF